MKIERLLLVLIIGYLLLTGTEEFLKKDHLGLDKGLKEDGEFIYSKNKRDMDFKNYSKDYNGESLRPINTRGELDPKDVAIGKFKDEFSFLPKTIKLKDGGDVYYMYGSLDRKHYKMKFRVGDASIIYSNIREHRGKNN